MIKKAIHTAAALLAAALLAAGCQQDEGLEPMQQQGPGNGFVKLVFRADIPEPETQNIGTRAVDPDGGGVNNMTLFCFDNFGLFITTATATVTKTGTLEGTFTAEVPYHTRRIHFVANQNMTDFTEQAFINKSESEVMALLEGSAGYMIYWARFACAPDSDASKTIFDQITEQQGGKITMLRNHALVIVKNPEIAENGAIEITGMAACNIQAFGTVAPYDPELGFDFTLDQWRAGSYVTIPRRDAKQSDIMDVTVNTSQYIFEHENTSDDPVSIILRGHLAGQTAADDLYYRIMLADEKGDFIPVRRNHTYILDIRGLLSYGQPTFEEALTAPATNNVWVSISDDVNEVEDRNYILRVDQTSIVYNDVDNASLKSVSLKYYLTGKNTDGTQTYLTENDMAQVTWIDNTVAAQAISSHDFELTGDKTGATGTFTISLLSLGSNDRLEGTLLVKHGRLQRKIKIILIRKQSFAPAWVGTAIYGETVPAVGNRRHVNLMFTIPEDCPAELFPMNVYLTVPTGLDVRNASGMVLPVVRKGDSQWYQSSDGPASADYKYVYTVTQPGKQRIYFENVLMQTDGTRKMLYIEAPHFTTLPRTYTYTYTQYAITIENLKSYSAVSEAGGAKDEYIYYYQVAQKAGADVEFKIYLRERTGDGAPDSNGIIQEEYSDEVINPTEKDEFLFYTQNLTNYNAEEDETLDCFFSRYNAKAEAWWTTINPDGGRMLMFKPREEKLNTNGGKYSLKMYTNRARSAETVRIASNLNNQPAVSTSDPDDRGEDGYYGGQVYRSQTFELANYTPFRFGARVRYAGGAWEGGEPDGRDDPGKDIQETVTPLVWTFEPDRKVDIAIDVTSFEGSDHSSVDPFGREFEIYIDAPMLRIDEARLAEFNLNAGKLKADPAVPGRFIYTVEADREAERDFGSANALNTDNSTNPDQTGERKILPFAVNSVASAGDIVLSSNKEQVVFYDKTFRVTNESIKGKIVYEAENADGSITQVPVPDDMFVAFERVTNSNRIGSVTMTATGEFELRLRKEYPLNWLGYPVAFHFEHGEHLHHANYDNLAEMYAAMQRGETVVLKREPQNQSSQSK